jgi:hypothetical protein
MKPNLFQSIITSIEIRMVLNRPFSPALCSDTTSLTSDRHDQQSRRRVCYSSPSVRSGPGRVVVNGASSAETQPGFVINWEN